MIRKIDEKTNLELVSLLYSQIFVNQFLNIR